MTIGEKIQILRKEKNLSQEELASSIGVSRQALSKWECDTSLPDIDKIIALSEYFNVTTDYLLKDKVPEESPKNDSHVNPGSALAFTTIITAIGLITAYSMANDGSNLLYWEVSSAMWGFIIQTIGIGLFEMFFFGYHFKKETQYKFWRINSWVLSVMPIIFLFGFISRFITMSSLLYIPIIAFFYILFNITFNAVLSLIERKPEL